MIRCPTCNEPMMLRKNQTDYKCMYCQQTVKPECELTQVIAIQPELSQPDAEGWWWFKGSFMDITVSDVVLLNVLEGLSVVRWNDTVIKITSLKGKFIKAIVPEFKEKWKCKKCGSYQFHIIGILTPKPYRECATCNFKEE
jgi:ssDNA-binding Zn-finger/Zn-ribbon topoisomerase 1